jgi:hypothetical protein
MALTISGSRINVLPGEPGFSVFGNVCAYFRLGAQDDSECWLEGQIVGPLREFVFTGRLYAPDQGPTIRLNRFPRGPLPTDWRVVQQHGGDGWELLDPDGVVVFGFAVDDQRICRVTVDLFRSDGARMARGGHEGLYADVPVVVSHGGITLVGCGQRPPLDYAVDLPRHFTAMAQNDGAAAL